jgi:chromosome segregation ATPase
MNNNEDKATAKKAFYKRKYQRTHRDKMRLLEARYRATHREQCRERLQRWRMARKQEREQIQALQATLAELMGKLSTLEHTRVQDERQRLQWGWDIQQVRIKLRRTRGEVERLSARRRS